MIFLVWWFVVVVCFSGFGGLLWWLD